MLIDCIESEVSEAGLKTGIGFKVLNCEMILLTHNWIIDNKSRILCVGIVSMH